MKIYLCFHIQRSIKMFKTGHRLRLINKENIDIKNVLKVDRFLGIQQIRIH